MIRNTFLWNVDDVQNRTRINFPIQAIILKWNIVPYLGLFQWCSIKLPRAIWDHTINWYFHIWICFIANVNASAQCNFCHEMWWLGTKYSFNFRFPSYMNIPFPNLCNMWDISFSFSFILLCFFKIKKCVFTTMLTSVKRNHSLTEL